MPSYLVKIPIIVCDPETNKPIDDDDRSICSHVEAETSAQAVRQFVKHLFELGEDGDDREEGVLS